MEIRINDNNYFVENTNAQIESMFTGKTTTANGTFKVLNNRIHFFDMQGNLFAALIKNKSGDCFFVNAAMHDCLGGKVFYQYATGEIQEGKLGLKGMGYRAQIETAERIASQLIEAQ